MTLDDGDLAYMRETQAEHRPTPADLSTKSEGPDGMGGRTEVWGPGSPIMIRLDGAEEPPADVASVNQGPLTKITMDLVDVRSGDRITVNPTEVYLIVTDGDPDRWQTAQVVWARRIAFPVRA
jgi:hypothetical protein